MTVNSPCMSPGGLRAWTLATVIPLAPHAKSIMNANARTVVRGVALESRSVSLMVTTAATHAPAAHTPATHSGGARTAHVHAAAAATASRTVAGNFRMTRISHRDEWR